MARTGNKISLYKTTTQGQVADALNLENGEIAMNYNSNSPFLMFKNNDGTIEKIPTLASSTGDSVYKTMTQASITSALNAKANKTDLTDKLGTKQDKLTQGDNITIDGNKISATNTTYSADGDIQTSGNKFSYSHPTDGASVTNRFVKVNVDGLGHVTGTTDVSKTDITSALTYTPQIKLTPGSNINLDENGNISATNTTYSADGDIQTSGNKFSYSHPTNGDKTTNGFVKVSVDGLGHVTGTTNVGSSDITRVLGYTPAKLGSDGRVISSQLPSYVDDVVEVSSLPTSGESGKIYIDTSTNKTYRWNGKSFVEISSSIILGIGASDAYYGDKGLAAYNHSTVVTGNPHGVTKGQVGLGNVSNLNATDTVSTGLNGTIVNNNLKAGSNISISVASDGKCQISASDMRYTHPTHSVTSGFVKVSVDSLGHVTGTTAVSKTDINGKIGYTPQKPLIKGSNINLDSNGNISATNTTYSAGGEISTSGTKFSYTHPSDGVSVANNGFVKVVINSRGHVTSTTKVLKSDITDLLGDTYDCGTF